MEKLELDYPGIGSANICFTIGRQKSELKGIG